jgi:tetratricopeptide (TPR) repeat protein
MILGALALIGAGGGAAVYLGRNRARDQLLETGQALLAEGKLREARGIATVLMADYPDFLDGYLLAAWTLRALHDRPGTADVLGKAYNLAPRGFPMLPEYVDHRMRGADDPTKGFDALAFLDSHARYFPEDANLVAQSRLVVYAYLLGQESLEGPQRQEMTEKAEDALKVFQIDGVGTTGQHYDRAQALLALGRFDESVAAGRAGIAANTDKWQSLVMHWAIATSLLHRGQDEQAWSEIQSLLSSLGSWSGTHFGMGKPLVEFVRLTSAIRFGQRLDPPADYAARLDRLTLEGVKLQYGDDETRALIADLLSALEHQDTPRGLRLVEDLLKVVARDRGCEMENQIIRPNTECMLYVARGNLYMQVREYALAESAYRVALALFPEDAWLDLKVGSAQLAVPEGQEMDPDKVRQRFKAG